MITCRTDDEGGWMIKSGFVYDTNSDYVTLRMDGEIHCVEYSDIINFK